MNTIKVRNCDTGGTMDVYVRTDYLLDRNNVNHWGKTPCSKGPKTYVFLVSDDEIKKYNQSEGNA